MDYSNLSKAVERLQVDWTYGLKIVEGSQLKGVYSLLHTPDENAIYEFEEGDLIEVPINDLAKAMYPPDYEIWTISNSHLVGLQYRKQSIAETSIFNISEDVSYIYFPMCPQTRSMNAFAELIAHLRSAEGCPWDRKQTHATLRTNLLEETYEVLEAIDAENKKLLQEELGDLLLQIVLHAQIASENQHFNIYKVIDGIYQKIVFRHPHVFSNWDVNDSTDVMRNWEILKSQERQKKEIKKYLLDSVPKSLPALSVAQKYQERAARVGFDWPEIAPVIEKIQEEIEEIKSAETSSSRERELGDLLFAIVNLIRWHGLDAESLLREMNKRFLSRFTYIEKTVAHQGRKMNDLTLAEMDEIWELAKKDESKPVQNGR